MVVLNYTGGEINAKIVYYGPGVSGKTTNLEYIHEKTPAASRGKMVSMKTQTDRTLFFDFLPLELGEINGYRTRFLLYTVPGQVYYNATRKLVLKGVDAVVFVADSSAAKLDENHESLRNLEQNLNEHGLSLDDIPWVIQYNKRDLPDAMSVQELDASLNPLHVPTFEAVATGGVGVYETFHGIATLVYGVLKERLERDDLESGVGVSRPAQAAEHAPAGARPAPPAHTQTATAPPASGPATAPRAAAAPAAAPTAAAFDATATQEAPAIETLGEEMDAEGVDIEHEVNHAVDFALRESEEQPRASTPAPPAPPSPPSAPKPAGNDGLFESIPESPFDEELGRVPALDEASAASDSVRDEGPDEFVTDPMRHPVPAPKADPAASRPAEKAAAPLEPARHMKDPKPADTPAPTAPATPSQAAPAAPQVTPAPPQAVPEAVQMHVPVILSRAQIEQSTSFEIILDVTVTDD